MNKSSKKVDKGGRRTFLKSSAAMGGLAFAPVFVPKLWDMDMKINAKSTMAEKSIIGTYGPWAAGIATQPPKLSFRNRDRQNLEKWREEAMDKTRECIAAPDIGRAPAVRVDDQYVYDGLAIEEISWQLPYGNRTEAVVLKPEGTVEPLPGILGLHDHAGNKYFGKRKITRTSDNMHPMMVAHQKEDYGGRAWANDLARRGYVVLVHDAFAFASRRVRLSETTGIPVPDFGTGGHSDVEAEMPENIDSYNKWAAEHEHIMAKSLFCAGTTWPGVFLGEDRCALDILGQREDVDSGRLGCAGLSGGGLRTVYLGGLDHRIKCAIAVGFMSTWNDFLLHKSYTHTWMTYAPLLPAYLDFPEILGLRVPLPTMTLNNNQDRLYTLPEMKRASRILEEVFGKAGAGDRYSGRFYDGGHKFDREMQRDAFAWFDRWL